MIFDQNKCAEIYLITSPSGKIYVGKANLVTSSGKPHGIFKRWSGHLSDARASNGGNCRLLNQEIRTYSPKEFTIQPLLTCLASDTSFFEKHMINEYRSLYDSKKNPFGLNLQQGGNSGPLSPETRQIMSINRRKNPHFSKPHTIETKQKISQSLIDNVTRYDHDGSILPKYVKYINWKDRIGYQVVSHPSRKNKYFVSSSKPPDILFQECMHYLEAPASD